ncbi:phosphatase PAP2 family protein, partial [Leucobacter sp. M11]|uniref:phosphatase PAP2 family protein n=1 Tax=Leucobacter sp. M11 TaxID=2993565 RepID=UPI002D7EE185
IASEFLKSVVQRPRPLDALIAAGGDSFPSGHSTAAAALAICVALLVRRAWVWLLAVGWVLAMMLSRQVLLVHWLSDTVAGALLGTAAAVLATRFALNRARARHDHPEHPAHE